MSGLSGVMSDLRFSSCNSEGPVDVSSGNPTTDDSVFLNSNEVDGLAGISEETNNLSFSDATDAPVQPTFEECKQTRQGALNCGIRNASWPPWSTAAATSTQDQVTDENPSLYLAKDHFCQPSFEDCKEADRETENREVQMNPTPYSPTPDSPFATKYPSVSEDLKPTRSRTPIREATFNLNRTPLATLATNSSMRHEEMPDRDRTNLSSTPMDPKPFGTPNQNVNFAKPFTGYGTPNSQEPNFAKLGYGTPSNQEVSFAKPDPKSSLPRKKSVNFVFESCTSTEQESVVSSLFESGRRSLRLSDLFERTGCKPDSFVTPVDTKKQLALQTVSSNFALFDRMAVTVCIIYLLLLLFVIT